MYSIVLVLKPFTHREGVAFNNLERFLSIGIVTYEKFLKKEEVKTFFVIVPNADVPYVTKELQEKHPSWPWKVIQEETLISPAIPSGWARQQTCKLAVSMLVSTDQYLIIDDDTYLTRPFCESDMYDPTSKKLLMNRTAIDFPFFFFWSAQILEADFDMVQDAPTHMAITPEIFVTSVVRDIVKWLVDKYGNQKHWQIHLANHKFTEYCIYWIWLLQHKLADTYYDTTSSYKLYEHATTSPDQDLRERVLKSFTDNAHHWFSFVQSSLDIPVHHVRKLIYDRLGLDHE